MTDILNQIKSEIEIFNNKSIEVVPGFEFNQKSTLNRIYLYYHSRYESGDIDDQGDKKYFYNISRKPCNVATKAIDFDTKHINLQTAGGGIPLKTWFFEKDLKFWMKNQIFGKVLNRIFKELPKFGSVVLKIIDGKIYFVDLRNFVVDQSADSLNESDHIIEIHNYTLSGFRRLGKEKKWGNIEEVVALFEEMDTTYITVYERYGEVQNEEDGNYTYKRVTIADVGKDEDGDEDNKEYKGIILSEEKIDKHPYREFHFEKIPGRWLGVGRVEVVFDPQIRTNEISNQQVKSSYWATLRLWQTRDEGVNRNLLTDVDNGEVINAESEITQIDMADRNLAYYANEIARWLGNRDELTFSYDVISGERLPAGTPLGSAQIAAGMAGSYFDQIREDVAMDIKEMLYEVIIPQFKKENSAEHALNLTGEDLDKVNDLIIESQMRKKVFDFLVREKKLPNIVQVDLIKSILSKQVKKGKEKLLKIPSSFYDNVKYKIDIVITGEALDNRVKAANLFSALQAITADPTLLIDPIKKKFFYKFLEQGGINPVDLESEKEMPSIEEVGKRAGGGVSKPTIPPSPISGKRDETL